MFEGIDLSDVNWQAVGAVASGVAALVTAYLAWSTRHLARSTKDMAESTREMTSATVRMASATEQSLEMAREELALLARQTEVTEKGFEQQAIPQVRLLRWGSDAAIHLGSEGDVQVEFENSGDVRLTVTEAKFDLAQPLILVFGDSSVLDTDDALQGWNDAAMQNAHFRGAVQRSEEMSLLFRYTGPSGARRNTRVRVKPKDGGDRWVIVGDEEHSSKDLQVGRAHFF